MRLAKLKTIPKGPASVDIKSQLVGLAFPVITGYIKDLLDSEYNMDQAVVNISMADFINTLFRHENGAELVPYYQNLFGQYNPVVTFRLSECEIIEI